MKAQGEVVSWPLSALVTSLLDLRLALVEGQRGHEHKMILGWVVKGSFLG